MTTPGDPTLARMHESMAAAHRLALDAALTARAVGMRDGINAAANVIAAAAKTPDLPEAFTAELERVRDAIRLLAYQISDPAPIGESS